MESERVLELLRSHPLTEELVKRESARILAVRAEASARLEEIEIEGAKVLPALAAAVTDAEAALSAHDATRKALMDRTTSARGALLAARCRLDLERAQAETILLENADPAIGDAIDFFRVKADELRARSAATDTRSAGINLATMSRKLVVRTNQPALAAAILHCVRAIRDLEAMKLRPIPDTDRIEELKQGVPNPDEMTEIPAEKPLPGEPNPLDLLPSDSEREWRLGKLTERFHKIMRR